MKFGSPESAGLENQDSLIDDVEKAREMAQTSDPVSTEAEFWKKEAGDSERVSGIARGEAVNPNPDKSVLFSGSENSVRRQLEAEATKLEKQADLAETIAAIKYDTRRLAESLSEQELEDEYQTAIRGLSEAVRSGAGKQKPDGEYYPEYIKALFRIRTLEAFRNEQNEGEGELSETPEEFETRWKAKFADQEDWVLKQTIESLDRLLEPDTPTVTMDPKAREQGEIKLRLAKEVLESRN